ncbi:MAG: Asp-tRNA(Asn)/Glu-tRNA(Gln) amidotransferase subunit GatC [Myxococcales bacterium]|nr:Asp-tRNA(Asn)/Glu-tRNA(Gln) amidotransferase subunit GatC [Myxococcales bacterium]
MLDEAEVRQVARLARLGLTDEEVGVMRGQLAGVLAHVRDLDAVDVEGVDPLGLAPAGMGSREDDVRAGLAREDALAGAPEPVDEGFGVPKAFE